MAEHDFQPFHAMAENFSYYGNWPSETVISKMTEIISHYVKWLISHIDCKHRWSCRLRNVADTTFALLYYNNIIEIGSEGGIRTDFRFWLESWRLEFNWVQRNWYRCVSRSWDTWTSRAVPKVGTVTGPSQGHPQESPDIAPLITLSHPSRC